MKKCSWVFAFSVSLCLCGDLFSAPPAKPFTYNDDVLPVLRQNCVACHNADKARGGLNAATYAKLMEGGGSGPVVKPGDPAASRLFRLTAHLETPHMPPKGAAKIPDVSLEKIRLWIEQGARENAGSKAIAAAKPKIDIGLKSLVKGRPSGPPPMPGARAKLRQDPVVRGRRPEAVTALAASPWAPLVAVGAPHQVLLYNSDNLDLLGVLPFVPGEPKVLKFSRNGKLLLAGGGRGGAAGKVVVWNVETGAKIIEVGQETDTVLAADISPDQTQIALGGPSKIIRIYSTTDGSLVREIKKHTDWIYAIEYSPDGVLLATADRVGGLFVWEAFTGRPYFELRGHTAAVTAVSWRADSNVLASGSEDGTIRLWGMENGNQIKAWGHGSGVEWVQYHHDGRIVSAGRDRTVKLWDGNGGAQRTFAAFPDLALRAVFAHDGARVIGGDWSGLVRVFTAADGKVVGTLSNNPLPVVERLAAAEKELADAQSAAQKAQAAFASADAASKKAAEELAAAQKAVPATAAAARTATAAVGPAKAALDRAAAAVSAHQMTVTARDVAAKAYGEAATRIKAASDAAPTNKELTAAARQGRDLSAKAAAELTAAQKTLGDAQSALKTATVTYATAQKAAGDMAKAAAEAPKLVAVKQPLVKLTGAAAATAKAALDRANAVLTVAKQRLERMRAAQAVATR